MGNRSSNSIPKKAKRIGKTHNAWRMYNESMPSGIESYPKFRTMAVVFILFCLFRPVLVHCAVSSPAPPEDTNVLLITIDTLRYDRISILPRLLGDLERLKKSLTGTGTTQDLLSRLGIMSAMAKRYGESIETLELAVKKDKYNQDNFNYLGLAYMKTGKLSLAEDQFKKALELKPDLVAALNNLG
jgi:tetratricopeptide (TPR) repeat protein